MSEKRPGGRPDRPPYRKEAGARGARDKRPARRPEPPEPSVEARRLALVALSDVARAGAYAGLALDKQLRASSISPEDKRLATSIFYSALENRLRIDYLLGQFLGRKPEPILEDILHIAVAQILFMDKIPDHAACDQAVRLTKRFGRESASGMVNGVLRNLMRARDAGELTYPDRTQFPVRYLSVMYSLPEPLVKRLVDAYGEAEAERMIAYRPDERVETVRPNALQMDDEAFEAYAARKGWSWRPGPVPGCLVLTRPGDLTGDPDFRAGAYSVQGPSSMLAALAMEPKPGMQILDACAAPGGKSCLMAERMNNTGRVYAWDLHPHRVELIKAAQARLGLDNLRPAVRDASVFRPDSEGVMDGVLVDAPCSGLGVMINKPDIKYRQSEQSIAGLVEAQRAILEACCRYVRPGGLLVYSTCTVLPEENGEQVRAFLARHPEFEPDLETGWLPEALRPLVREGTLQLQAHLNGMEGFFIARMRRRRQA